MAEDRAQRRLAAIMAADVVGYSRLIEADEEGTRTRLRSLQADIIEPQIAADGGRIVKTMGDGILVEFSSAVNAVRNALAIQQAMNQRNADTPEALRIQFRVGINVGDVIVEGDDIHGDGVNVAARLEGICEPGAVYVSGTVFDQASGKLEVSFEDLGESKVKNITKPVRVYRLLHGKLEETVSPINSTEPLALPEKPSIAVLPFHNLSGSPEQEYFADGLAEDIIAGLARFSWLFVIARNTSFTFKDQQADVQTVARELGVRYVLEGSVRSAKNRIRVTAQLNDGTTGKQIWADKYDRDLEDIFAVQDEITLTVVGAVEPELSRSEREKVLRKPPDNLNAWEVYQKGLWHLWQFSREGHRQATALFEKSTQIDPGFSPAFAALSYVKFASCMRGYSSNPKKDSAQAYRAGTTAVSLDKSDAFARFALGSACLLQRDFTAACEELGEAMKLNPSFSPAYSQYGASLVFSGRAGEAFHYFDLADRISPKDPLWWLSAMLRAYAHFFLGENEQAIQLARRTIRGEQRGNLARAIYVAALIESGRHAEAKDAMGELLEIDPNLSISTIDELWPIDEARRGFLLAALAKAGLPNA